MIIGVDAACLAVKNPNLKTGIYIVAYNLLCELAQIDKENVYFLYSFSPIEEKLMRKFPKYSRNIIAKPARGWQHIGLPIKFLAKRPDVFLAMSQAMPRFHPFRTIGFIHGLDFLPEFHLVRTAKMKHDTSYLLKHAQKIITTSGYLKNEIKKLYGKNNASIIPLGVNTKIFQGVKPYFKKTPYFLFVGTLKPSKNIPILLESFAEFLKHTQLRYSLLLVGSNFWLDKKIEEFSRKLHIEKYISVVPSQDQGMLAKYYKGAIALVMPSLYEGFGLPALEAMAAGCPVISSSVGALPEVIGGAGLLAEPLDYKKFAKHMEMIATDKRLREELIERGIKKSKEYSWKNYARQVLDIIEKT